MLFEKDWDVLVESLSLVKGDKYVEVGCGTGITARDLVALIKEPFHYYGIDPLIRKPHNSRKREPEFKHPNFTFVRRMSFKCVDYIPGDINWMFIDACHCQECVERDIRMYTPKLADKAVLCFHDASPKVQGKYPQDYPDLKGYHNEEKARQGINVLKALSILPASFKLYKEALDQEKGGIRVYMLS